ncbi:16343_t:CDS:2, partial [Cetraspora pellucida]
MKKSSESSVNKLLVGGSSVNKLLVRTSTSWSLSVVGGSSVSRSLGIRSLVRTLDRRSLINRTLVEDDILDYDSTSKRRTFNMNDINNNKRQATDKLMKDFKLVDLISQSSQTLSIADPIDLVTEIYVETNIMPNDAKIINVILNHNCNEDDEVEFK